MIHSFNIVSNVNGNTTVKFTQDTKLRNIIFQKNSVAAKEFWLVFDYIAKNNPNYDSNQQIEATVIYMKKKYIFKANVNNVSIFRPVAKSLILN
jgi:hypothetical protein